MLFLSSSQRVVSICVSCFRFLFFGGAPFKKPNEKYFLNIFLGRGSGHFLVIFFREGHVFFLVLGGPFHRVSIGRGG